MSRPVPAAAPASQPRAAPHRTAPHRTPAPPAGAARGRRHRRAAEEDARNATQQGMHAAAAPDVNLKMPIKPGKRIVGAGMRKCLQKYDVVLSFIS